MAGIRTLLRVLGALIATATPAWAVPAYQRPQDTPWTAERLASTQARANADDANAEEELGQYYLGWAGMPPDYVEAARWFKMAAAHPGQSYAQGEFDRTSKFITDHADLYAKALSGKADDLYAFAKHEPHMATGLDGDAPTPHWLLLAAEAGSIPAERDLGQLYLRAWFLRRDGLTAVDSLNVNDYWTDWLPQHLESYSLNFEGENADDDIANAIRWLTPAATADDPEAEYNLGLAYAVTGPLQDPIRARNWLNASVGRLSNFQDGACYLDFGGRFIDMRLDKPNNWFNDGTPMIDLTMPPDYALAYDCYSRIMNRHYEARYFLGYMLHRGLGTGRSDIDAVSALKSTRNTSYWPEAEAELGRIYADSDSVPRDPVMAYMYTAEALGGFNAPRSRCVMETDADHLQDMDRGLARPDLLKARRRFWLALTPAQRASADARLYAEHMPTEGPPPKPKPGAPPIMVEPPMCWD